MIYLDTCILVYFVEEDATFGARVARSIEAAGDATFVISPLVRLECLVKPIRDADLVLIDRYRNAFDLVETLAMDESVFDAAAHLRARFGLRTPDALHLACAQRHGCESLWTNDTRLARADRGLARDLFRSGPGLDPQPRE